MKNRTWQAKVLKVLALLFIGMLLRDPIAMLFKSLYEVIARDWTAAASFTAILAIFGLIVHVLSSYKTTHSVSRGKKKAKSVKKADDKPAQKFDNTPKPQSFQQNNPNQNRQ